MAFFRRPKLPTKKAPLRPWTNEEIKVIGWCMNKNIHVGITPGNTNWKVEIRMNKGDWKQDPGVYEHEEAMKKMYEYYKYYYDIYNK